MFVMVRTGKTFQILPFGSYKELDGALKLKNWICIKASLKLFQASVLSTAPIQSHLLQPTMKVRLKVSTKSEQFEYISFFCFFTVNWKFDTFIHQSDLRQLSTFQLAKHCMWKGFLMSNLSNCCLSWIILQCKSVKKQVY